MPYSKMPKELIEQVAAIANSDFEENESTFTNLPPQDVFIFSYIHGFRDAYVSYASDEGGEMSEVSIGEIVTEVPSDIIAAATSGAEREFKKYSDKIKSIQLKEVYSLGFQAGFESGFEVYSDEDSKKKDVHPSIKYYHANFDRLH